MIGIKQVYETNLTQPYKSIDGWVNTILKVSFSVVPIVDSQQINQLQDNERHFRLVSS